MICSIAGELVSVGETSIVVRPQGGLSYELMVPAYAIPTLVAQIGQQVRLETRSYIESQAQGAVLIPRLVGFLSSDEKAFFELFTTVKGLGARRALRALALPPVEVATAIAERDHRALQELPEIGKRLAETIIVDLADKVTRFTWVAPSTAVEGKPARRSAAAIEAAAALVALGQNPADAERLVDRALASAKANGRELATPDAIITSALQAR
ncbi:MAG: Holliday junction DNA helicase RuvA [Leptolyngbya sp. PLA3]|nr:MAG: Holliday junction DNA helicase RuvA [Cyanobacteria bacterium CYA]MCE7969332.1 Holliday junction DNA helicase RuvA [Leptolyngbya sp. PL-A3]